MTTMMTMQKNGSKINPKLTWRSLGSQVNLIASDAYDVWVKGDSEIARQLDELIKLQGVPKRRPEEYERKRHCRNSLAIRELLLKGLTPVQIAKELGIRRQSVAHHRRKLGLPPFKPGRIKGEK